MLVCHKERNVSVLAFYVDMYVKKVDAMQNNYINEQGGL